MYYSIFLNDCTLSILALKLHECVVLFYFAHSFNIESTWECKNTDVVHGGKMFKKNYDHLTTKYSFGIIGEGDKKSSVDL